MNSNVLVANLRARKSESTVMTQSKSIAIDQNKKFVPLKETVNFPIQTEKGVRNVLNKFSLPLATITGLVSTLLAEPVFAENIMGAQSSQMNSGDWIEMMIQAAVYLNVAVIGASIIKPPIIHFVNFFSPSLAENMANRLANGLGMTLYWQIIVIAMVYLAHLLLGSSPYYIDTWAIFAPHIKPAIKHVVDLLGH